MLVQCEGLTQRVILGRQPAIISLSSCNSRPCTIARAEIEKNGAVGISDIEHVASEGMELLGKAT